MKQALPPFIRARRDLTHVCCPRPYHHPVYFTQLVLTSMSIVETLVNRAIKASEGKDRCLITLAGIPGSGKSTAGLLVTEELNRRGINTVLVGMDGYHYTREDLANRIGVEKAVKFRGAPYTFDAPGVVSLAKQLAMPVEVNFPTFDHALKDPKPDAGHIPASTKIVILEGLYLHLKDLEWQGIMEVASDTWWIEVDPEVARERLAKRHLQSGIVATLEEGRTRADTNDLVNGTYIIENSRSPAFKF